MKLKDENGKEYEFTACTNSGKSGVVELIKPKTKKIDMSVCVESKILCEVDSQEPCFKSTALVKLKAIHPTIEAKYEAERGSLWLRCRPAMNGHIHAKPKGWYKCPIPEGFIVVAYDNGVPAGFVSGIDIDWQKGIAMFEITGIAEGWEL